MSKVVIYTKETCPYCHFAKELLDSKNISYQEIRVDLNQDALTEMMHLSKRRTVPQIAINGHFIGGYDDLVKLIGTGEFDELLKS